MSLRNQRSRNAEDVLISRYLKKWVSRESLPLDARDRLMRAARSQAPIRQKKNDIFVCRPHNNFNEITFTVFARATAYSLQTCISML